MRGFTLIELLVAMAITLAIAGALAQAVGPARDAFNRVPADLELQQRGRAAIDALARAVRSAESVSLGDPDGTGSFGSMLVVSVVIDGARGMLSEDQVAPDASLTLDVSPCPNIKDVCGFKAGSLAMISDLASSEIFTVATTHSGTRRLTPGAALTKAYATRSTVSELEPHAFSLVEQADGSHSLVRETAAGAVQPMVDFVSELRFSLQAARVDITLAVQAPTDALRRALPERVFRTSIRLRTTYD